MKRILSIVLVAMLLFSCHALAENDTWTCKNDGSENNSNYCPLCGTAKREATTWTCPGCGKQELESAYCPDCGTKRPEVKVININSCEGPGFDTPEEAVAAYLKAIISSDIASAVPTFAIESFVKNYDANQAIITYRSVIASNTLTIPVSGAFSESLLTERRRADVSQPILYMYLTYSTAGTDYASLGETAMRSFGKNEDEVSNYLEVMRNSPFESAIDQIKVNGVYRAEDPSVKAYVPRSYYNERLQENLEKFRSTIGADEMAEVIALFTFNGDEYVQLMQCVRYGDRWYNYRQQSYIASLIGLSVYQGGVAPAELVAGYCR